MNKQLPIITSQKLRELLVALTSPREKLQDTVDFALVKIADDLAAQVAEDASQLASYRRSAVLEARDIFYAAERQYGIQGVEKALPSGGTVSHVEMEVESGVEDFQQHHLDGSIDSPPSKRGRKPGSGRGASAIHKRR
jgi:histone H3/H4